eukprot:Rmarinus@m.29686
MTQGEQHLTEAKIVCPKFSAEEAIDLVKSHWGMQDIAVASFPSYDDQNFLIKVDGEPFSVLKISNTSEVESNLLFQHAAMNHLKEDGFQTSYPIQMTNGDEVGTTTNKEGVPHLYRMLKFVPGTVIDKFKPLSDSLIRNVGEYVGKMDLSLSKFSHPKAYRKMAWDLCQFRDIKRYVKHLSTKERHEMVSHVIDMYEETVVPEMDKLPRQVVQNDPNELNVLVDDGKVSGIIDFGDMLHTLRVNEVGITAGYMCLDTADPVHAMACVVEGYHSANPLSEEELRLVFPLACSRIAFSLTMSAYGLVIEPENTYLQTIVGPGWPTMRILVKTDPKDALQIFRERCGFDAPK